MRSSQPGSMAGCVAAITIMICPQYLQRGLYEASGGDGLAVGAFITGNGHIRSIQ